MMSRYLTIIIVEVVLSVVAWFAGGQLRGDSVVSGDGSGNERFASSIVRPGHSPRFEMTCDEEMLRVVKVALEAVSEQEAAPQRRRDWIREKLLETWVEPHDFEAARDPSLYDMDVLWGNMQRFLDECNEDVELVGLECNEYSCTGAILSDDLKSPGQCGDAWDRWTALYGNSMSWGSGSGDCPDGTTATLAIWGPSKAAVPCESGDSLGLDCSELEPEECRAAFERTIEEELASFDQVVDEWNRMAVEYGCGDE